MKTSRHIKYFTHCLLLGAGLAAGGRAEPLSLVSVREGAQAPPAPGDGDSMAPILTPDSRYVLFASTADNLVAINGSNSLPKLIIPMLNVFRRDRSNDSTTLVSVNLSATGGGDGNSLPTAISDDGRYALFESSADDLVPGDTNGVADVFLRDTWSNLTVLVSISTNSGAANGVSRGSTLTPEGRYVAFTSAASNLVPNDTNSIPDVFIRDWQSGVTLLASVGAQAIAPYSPIGSESPEVSADGRFVAFYSTATNLVAGVTNSGEIYVRDLVAATTTLASAGAHERLGPTAISFNHSLSTNGNFVVYEACLSPPINSGVYQGIILRFNLATGLTDTIHTNAYAPAANPEDFHNLGLTPDGRFVAFIANTNTSPAAGVYLWDAQSGINTLVSGDLGGNVAAQGFCEWPTVDPTGRFVTFSSSASGLVTNSLAGDFHLYLKDLQTGVISLLDADTNGTGVGVSAATLPQMSADGSGFAFEAPEAGLVPDDRNHACDVLVRDAIAGTNELISPHDPAFPSASPNRASGLTAYSSSSDGRWVVFASEADNLVPNDTNGFRDIFVRDQLGGSNLLVSISTNGEPADGISSEPAISSDGQFVVFTSAADNLVAGDTNNAPDVFLRSLPAGPTVLVSVDASGGGSGNGPSGGAVISADGRMVLFNSQAGNLVVRNFNSGTANLFLRDLLAAKTYALTTGGFSAAAMTPDGRWVAFEGPTGITSQVFVWDSESAKLVRTISIGSAWPELAISPDGTKIICASGTPTELWLVDLLAGTNGPIGSGYVDLTSARVGLRFSADSRFLTFATAPTGYGTNQICLYDFQSRTETRISTALDSTNGANASSDSPDISADGRFIAYRSFAANLLPVSNRNGAPNVFLYDRLNRTTMLASASRLDGGTADNRSRTPSFSPDGHTLFFASWASDLAAQDFNQSGDVFALPFLYVTVLPGSAPGTGPTLTWPNRSGETYHVQFKSDLSEPAWQEVGGTVTITGNRASLTDPAPASAPRFYRVITY